VKHIKQAITSMVLVGTTQVFDYTADVDSLVDQYLTSAKGAMNWVGGWVGGWVDGWMGGWRDRRMDAWMEGQKDGCVNRWVHEWMSE